MPAIIFLEKGQRVQYWKGILIFQLKVAFNTVMFDRKLVIA